MSSELAEVKQRYEVTLAELEAARSASQAQTASAVTADELETKNSAITALQQEVDGLRVDIAAQRQQQLEQSQQHEAQQVLSCYRTCACGVTCRLILCLLCRSQSALAAQVVAAKQQISELQDEKDAVLAQSKDIITKLKAALTDARQSADDTAKEQSLLTVKTVRCNLPFFPLAALTVFTSLTRAIIADGTCRSWVCCTSAFLPAYRPMMTPR